MIKKLGAVVQSAVSEDLSEDTLIKVDHRYSNNFSMQRRLNTPEREEDEEDEEEEDEKDEKSTGDDEDDLDYVHVNVKKKNEPYFEKQQWEMCLLHSLNALYQENKFTAKRMDEICKTLAPNKLINPHKSIFNTGNYDANVLMMALDDEGVDVQWFDSRKASKDLKLNDKFLCPKDKYDEFLGFILNNPHKRMIVFNRRHWLTIKQIDNIWYNLDSRQKKPTKYQTKKEIKKLENWLIDAVKNNDAQLMICRIKKKNIDKNTKNTKNIKNTKNHKKTKKKITKKPHRQSYQSYQSRKSHKSYQSPQSHEAWF